MDRFFPVILFFLVLVVPLVIFELPFALALIPKKIQKLLCFIPCGGVGFLSIKILLENDIGLFFMSLFFFCITLYGGFAVQEMISSKNKY